MEDNLEQMRAQMSLLKDRLARHEIIHDTMILKTIKAHVASFNRMRNQNLTIITAAMLSTPLCLSTLNMPLWFLIFTIAFFLTALIYEYLSHDKIDSNSFSKDDLVAMSTKAAKIIRRNARWFLFSIPTVTIWFVLFVSEIITTTDNPEGRLYYLAGVATGGIIGCIIGIRRYRYAQRNAQSLIDEIEALKKS